MKRIEVAAAIICKDDKVFATQRGYGEFKDMWEFPGGKLEPGESAQQALEREIKEELDADICVEELIETVEMDYPSFHLTLYCFRCSLKCSGIFLKEHEAARWLGRGELRSVQWLPADESVLGTIERAMSYQPVESLKDFPAGPQTFRHCAFQYLDFTTVGDRLEGKRFADCCFLGCIIPKEMNARIASDCLVLPRLGMPYRAFTNRLYTPETLYEGYDPKYPESYAQSYDGRIFRDFSQKGKFCKDIKEMLARSIHDNSISDAINDFLASYDRSDVVAVMGGHAMNRGDEEYAKVVQISKRLTECGKLMVSGGGPGAMEATHLGAWMAGRSEEELQDAMAMLSVSQNFRDAGWLESAFAVRKKYPQKKFCSLSIPTWLYGHEPSTPFATHIAKFFDNSIRENHIVSVAMGGIIFSPGSAGTIREIFQDAEQNHYKTLGASSPMIFLGKKFYAKDVPVYSFLEDLLKNERYKGLSLSITDDCDEIIDEILKFKIG